MTEVQVSRGPRGENALARPALVLSVVALALTGLMFISFVVGRSVTALSFLVYLALLIPLVSVIVAVVGIVLGALALVQSRRQGSRAAALHALMYGIVAVLVPTIGFAVSVLAGS